jgi:hypothetical protein
MSDDRRENYEILNLTGHVFAEIDLEVGQALGFGKA